MMIVYRLLGPVAAIAYGLRRSKVGFVRLNVGLGALALLLAGYVGWRGRLDGFTLGRALVIALCFLIVILLIWAEARHYVLFRPGHLAASEEVPGLAAEKKLFLRGSGLFEVSNMRRHLVEVPVVLWSTELAEYVLAARVRALRVLGLGVPAMERGWWYIFLEPRRVSGIVGGELYFGLQRRSAVCISYRGPRAPQTVYLSSEDPQQVAIIANDLRSKVQAIQQEPDGQGSKRFLPSVVSRGELPDGNQPLI